MLYVSGSGATRFGSIRFALHPRRGPGPRHRPSRTQIGAGPQVLWRIGGSAATAAHSILHPADAIPPIAFKEAPDYVRTSSSHPVRAKMGSEWVFRCAGASRVRNGKTHSDPIFAG